MVSLDLYGAILDSAAGPAPPLQLSGQHLKLVFIKRNPGNDRDSLPAPSLRLPMDSDNAAASRGRGFFPADAPLNRLATGGADPPQFGGVDETCVWWAALGHSEQNTPGPYPATFRTIFPKCLSSSIIR